MRLIVLGSGTNLHPKRAGAGYFVETDHLCLFDLGPRTLTNLIKVGVDPHRIQHIFFSHYHADHFSDFITFFFDAVIHATHVGPRPPLTIYGPKGTRRLFTAILKEFPSFSPTPFPVTIKELTDETIHLGDTRITARTVIHSQQIHCQGYRVEYGGQATAYSGDAEYSKGLVRLCREVDVALLDCSFPAQRPVKGHMTARDCGQVAQEAGAGRLILSHFYPVAERYDVIGQAREEFDGRTDMARDRMRIELSPKPGLPSRPYRATRGSR
jgi:ribonuclease BN (tRNA processing enzyme)